MNERNERPTPFAQTYFHGTKADLQLGDLITIGQTSNYDSSEKSTHNYFTATLDAAIWGAELAAGTGRERIYLVEPTGEIENDPDLTDKKFPGNPTRSFRSTAPLRVVGEVTSWAGHASEQVETMRQGIQRILKEKNS